MLRQSPRRNGRNKGLKVKHVVQISMLLGVSIWLLYQVHRSDDKKTSVTTNISHKLNNVSNDDVLKLGRKVLRPKVNGTKEHQADENEASEEEGVIEDHESDEHEEVEENEKEIADKGREQSGLENEDVQMKQKQHEGKQSVEMKGKVKEKKSNEQNKDSVMDKIEKEVEVSSPSKEDDDRSVRDEVENDGMMKNGANDDQSREANAGSSKRPSIDHNEEGDKDLYSLEPNTVNTMKSTWNEKSMKPDTDSEALEKIGESIPSTELEQKDGVSMLEEEKDALTDLETLPESGTGGSITQENAATE